jgi:hypothetical protein
MSIFWNIFFWLTIVAVVGIVAAVILKVVNKNAETRKYLADAQYGGNYRAIAEASASTNAAVLARLTEVETRLGAIEKTLTDIP